MWNHFKHLATPSDQLLGYVKVLHATSQVVLHQVKPLIKPPRTSSQATSNQVQSLHKPFQTTSTLVTSHFTPRLKPCKPPHEHLHQPLETTSNHFTSSNQFIGYCLTPSFAEKVLPLLIGFLCAARGDQIPRDQGTGSLAWAMQFPYCHIGIASSYCLISISHLHI